MPLEKPPEFRREDPERCELSNVARQRLLQKVPPKHSVPSPSVLKACSVLSALSDDETRRGARRHRLIQNNWWANTRSYRARRPVGAAIS